MTFQEWWEDEGQHLPENNYDMAKDAWEVGQRELQAELTALKTPHTCVECEHSFKTINSRSLKCNCDDTPFIYSDAEDPGWLCGHFQKKGTK